MRYGYFALAVAFSCCVSVVLSESSGLATMYQCTDASGAQVFTDSAAQLRNCTAINLGAPAGQPPSAPFAPPSEPPTSPMFPAPGVPHQIQVPQNEPTHEQPFMPGENLVSNGQPCIAHINPVNPLASPPCQPGDAPPPQPGMVQPGAIGFPSGSEAMQP